jgi:hypothetical protein
MKELHLVLAKNAEQIINDELLRHPEDGLWNAMNSIKNNIVSDELAMPDQIKSEDAKSNLIKFSNTSKHIVLASLLKEANTKQGREFITLLSQSLNEQFKAKITDSYKLADKNELKLIASVTKRVPASGIDVKKLSKEMIYIKLGESGLKYITLGMSETLEIQNKKLGEKEISALKELSLLHDNLLISKKVFICENNTSINVWLADCSKKKLNTGSTTLETFQLIQNKILNIIEEQTQIKINTAPLGQRLENDINKNNGSGWGLLRITAELSPS